MQITSMQIQTHTERCLSRGDRQEKTNKHVHTPEQFSVVEHLPHIKNKSIQSQFGNVW